MNTLYTKEKIDAMRREREEAKKAYYAKHAGKKEIVIFWDMEKEPLKAGDLVTLVGIYDPDYDFTDWKISKENEDGIFHKEKEKSGDFDGLLKTVIEGHGQRKVEAIEATEKENCYKISLSADLHPDRN